MCYTIANRLSLIHICKDLRRIYVTVEKVALSVRTPERAALEGAELTVEELMEIYNGKKE